VRNRIFSDMGDSGGLRKKATADCRGSADAKEHHQAAVDLAQRGRIDAPQAVTDPVSTNGLQLVDHDLRRGRSPLFRATPSEFGDRNAHSVVRMR